MLADGFMTRQEVKRLSGWLNHVSYMIPFARPFMHRLRHMLHSTWYKRTKAFTTSQSVDLHSWNHFIRTACIGISINLLTYRAPTVNWWSDACLTGMGGYDSFSHAWRWEIPLQCRGRLTLNYLEYIASIITIKNFLSSHYNSKQFPCILYLLDGTSTIG